jgi:hypothetical protein
MGLWSIGALAASGDAGSLLRTVNRVYRLLSGVTSVGTIADAKSTRPPKSDAPPRTAKIGLVCVVVASASSLRVDSQAPRAQHGLRWAAYATLARRLDPYTTHSYVS